MTTIINQALSGRQDLEPEVGMGATYYGWSDRHAYTIVEVVRFKTGARKGQVKGVWATRDKAFRTDDHGMSDHQNYRFETDPAAHRQWALRNVHGRYVMNGAPFGIGARHEYFDYSF